MAVDHLIAQRVEHRREEQHHHRSGGDDGADDHGWRRSAPQREAMRVGERQPGQHQHRDDQHRRVERVRPDLDAKDVDGAAAAQGDGEGEAGHRDEQQIEGAAQADDADDGQVDGALEADELDQQAHPGHQQAEHAVVGVGAGRPGDHGAEPEGVTELPGLTEMAEQQRENRQRRGRDQAEVPDAARNEHRRQRESNPGDQRFGLAPRHRPGQQPGGIPGQGDVEQEDEVERGDQADQWNQRPGQHVGRGRVVVEAEVGRRRVGRASQNRRRIEGQPALLQFVREDPGVPDVDAGVARRRPGECVVEMTHEGPRRDDRNEEEPHEDGGVPPHATDHMAELGTRILARLPRRATT
jgi:hypothetical protein